MIFNDVVEWFSELKDMNIPLEQFKTELIDLREMNYKVSNTLMSKVVSGEINANNYGNYRNSTIAEFSKIKKSVQTINLLKIGKMIAKLEKISLIDDNLGKPLKELISVLEECSDKLYQYTNTEDMNMQCKNLTSLLCDINSTVEAINNINFISDFLNAINNAIQQEFNSNEIATLSIRLYDEMFTLKEINNHIQLITTIYERSCTIFGVSVTDYPLMPIKIETGSLFDKLVGHEKVMNFLGDLLNRGVGFIHRNYTKEGKVKDSPNKIQALKDHIGLIDLCEKQGMDMSNAKEIIEQNVEVLCNDLYKFTASSTKIAINGQVHDVRKEAVQALIQERTIKYLSNKLQVSEEIEVVMSE